MINEIGIRKYIRLLLEQRPEKVAFGNAESQSDFENRTKQIDTRLRDYISSGDFQISFPKKGVSAGKEAIFKKILQQQNHIANSKGKYKYFRRQKFTRDDLEKLFVDRDPANAQKWIPHTPAMTGNEFLGLVSRYYTFFNQIDIDNDGIPGDIDDISISLAHYFTKNEDEIKNNIKKNVYDKYVKTFNQDIVKDFKNVDVRSINEEEIANWMQRSQQYMKTMMRPYLEVFENEIIDFLYDELYFGAINATSESMQYNTTILLPYPNLYYSFDYIGNASSIGFHNIKKFYHELYQQVENMKKIFDTGTERNKMLRILSNAKEFNFIIYSFDLIWSPNLVIDTKEHEDLAVSDFYKNPNAFYDWEIKKAHAERISPDTLSPMDIDTFARTLKTHDNTQIVKKLTRSLERISKQKKYTDNKIANTRGLRDASRRAISRAKYDFTINELEEILEETLDVFEDITGLKPESILDENKLRTGDIKKREEILIKTLREFTAISNKLNASWFNAYFNAYNYDAWWNAGGRYEDETRNVKPVEILHGDPPGRNDNKVRADHLRVHNHFRQLIDPASEVQERSKTSKSTFTSDRTFTIVKKLGYDRKPFVKLAGGKFKSDSTPQTLTFVEHKFEPINYYGHIKYHRSHFDAPFTSYVPIPLIHKTRSSQKAMEKRFSINKDLWKALDELPQFNHYRSTEGKDSNIKREIELNILDFQKKLDIAEETLVSDWKKYVEVTNKLAMLNSQGLSTAVVDLLNVYKSYIDDEMSPEEFNNSVAGSSNVSSDKQIAARKKIFKDIGALLTLLNAARANKGNKIFSKSTNTFIDNLLHGTKSVNMVTGEQLSIADVIEKQKVFSGEFNKQQEKAKLKNIQDVFQKEKMEKFRLDLERRMNEREKVFDNLSDFTKHFQESLDIMSSMFEGLHPQIKEKYFSDRRFTITDVKEDLDSLESNTGDFKNMPVHMLNTILQTYKQMLQYQTFETEFAKTGKATTYSQDVELALTGQLADNEEYLRKMKKAAAEDDMALFERGKHELQQKLDNIIKKVNDPAIEIERAGQKAVEKAAQEGYELVEFMNNMFDEIEHIMELKEDFQKPGSKGAQARAKTFLKYMLGTIENHDGVEDDWQGKEIDYFEDLNIVFDNIVKPGKIFIGVTMHPENSTNLMSKMKARFGRSFENSDCTDYDYNGSISWNDYHLRDHKILYVHISIKPDAFSNTSDFNKAMELAEVLFHLCDELDKPMYKGRSKEFLKNLFGMDESYSMGDINKYFVNAINAKIYDPVEFFSEVMRESWMFSSKLKKEILLNFIIQKK